MSTIFLFSFLLNFQMGHNRDPSFPNLKSLLLFFRRAKFKFFFGILGNGIQYLELEGTRKHRVYAYAHSTHSWNVFPSLYFGSGRDPSKKKEDLLYSGFPRLKKKNEVAVQSILDIPRDSFVKVAKFIHFLINVYLLLKARAS